MLQHHGYVRSDSSGCFLPFATLSKGKGLGSLWVERGGQERQRVCVRIEHYLQSRLDFLIESDFRDRQTSFSSPVRYPNFKLQLMHFDLSPVAAACSNWNQLSIKDFEYSLVAPKSIKLI